MCEAIALAASEFPLSLLDGGLLDGRIHDREGSEVRFYWRARPALLPVWLDGRLQVVRWGNRCRSERLLPATGWTWRERVESGWWSKLSPEPVEVPATFAWAGGVWFKVRRGLRGLVVRDRGGGPVVYIVCEPPTRYFKVMTRAEWMPVLLDEVI